MGGRQIYARFIRWFSMIALANALVFTWRREFDIVCAYCAMTLMLAATCWLTELSRWNGED